MPGRSAFVAYPMMVYCLYSLYDFTAELEPRLRHKL